VFAVAARDAAPPLPLAADLIEAGPGAPDELQRIARAATLLLDPVQRGCLDLALRQGLEGEVLSEALGAAPGLASVSVQAATDQAEHVIGAVLLARVGRPWPVGPPRRLRSGCRRPGEPGAGGAPWRWAWPRRCWWASWPSCGPGAAATSPGRRRREAA